MEKQRHGLYKQSDKDPFAQTLVNLAKESGFKTQTALARALGINQNVVSSWYNDTNVPSSHYMALLLTTLKLEQHQIDDLADKYGICLREGRGYIGNQPDTEISFKTGHSKIKKFNDSPLSNWILEITEQKHLTQERFSKSLGFSASLLSKDRAYGFSLNVLASILEKATPVLELTENEERKLADAICDTFNRQLAEGNKMHYYNTSEGLTIQKQLVCITFTGGQAANRLGVSRETIRLQRIALGIEHTLLLEDDLESIRQNLTNSPMIHRFRGNNLSQ